jgi:hypothetical protein
MAYTVNKSNSSSSPNQYTVQDGAVNTQTDLSFIGKGYAGYGEVIAENFLHLLENFSNTSAPSKPIQGQLWWDSTNSKLQVYNGTAWQTAGGSAPYQSAAPSGLNQGDIWIDSDTGQMYFYNGTTSVLVGPPSSSGTTNGFTFESILDSGDTTQNITNIFNDGNRLAIISEDEFTPKVAITGFATIKKGITLTTAIADTKFQGTATDADALGGVAAANYLRSNANDTTSGHLSIANDTGLVVGADSDLTLTVDSTGAIISNTTQDKDITFRVNDAGTTTTIMTIDGSESRVGIGTTTPSTTLEVAGTVTATTFSGNFSGGIAGDISNSGTNSMGTLTMGGTLTTKNILPDTTTSYDIGSASKQYNLVYAKATSAQYADLAEKYTTPEDLVPGTVVAVLIGPGHDDILPEVQSASQGSIPVGVISTAPAYLMNADSEGQAVALKGRVPVRVIGTVSKGQAVYVDDNGCASYNEDGQSKYMVGIALTSKDTEEEGLVECILKV